MKRTDIINHLIKVYGYKSYLEIGVANGANFEAINCGHKVGVDPGSEYDKISHHTTSDRYFRDHKEKFDIIFIDGYHEQFQFYRDVKNAVQCLNPGGIIVCHDILPADENGGRDPEIGSGTCWKGWLDLRLKDELQMRVVDTDCGCGVIRIGADDNPLEDVDWMQEIRWDYVMRDEPVRKRIMNVISVEDFLKLYK